MAIVRIPDEQRTLHDAGEIIAFLSARGSGRSSNPADSTSSNA